MRDKPPLFRQAGVPLHWRSTTTPFRTLLAVAIALCANACSTSTAGSSSPSAIEYLNSGSVLPSTLPFSEAVRVGGTLYLSGQVGVLPGTTTLAAGGVLAETRQTLANIAAVLATHGYDRGDLVKCTVMLADMSDWPAFNEVYAAFFAAYDRFPARSAFGASGLALDARVEIECIAARDA